MRKSSAFAAVIFLVILGMGGGGAYALYRATGNLASVWLGALAFGIALGVSLAIKVADQWERVVILRLGKFRALKGPGLFFIIPVLDAIPYWIDTRVITAAFKAEKTLTKDVAGVPNCPGDVPGPSADLSQDQRDPAAGIAIPPQTALKALKAEL